MAIIANWVSKPDKASFSVEIPLFEERFVIHYFDKVIIKTQWCVESSSLSLEKNNLWQDVFDYINNPIEPLTVDLAKQGSAFRNKAWIAMCQIPIGQTITYSELARQVNSGARAVANACRDNPFPGIIPCHRVVAVSGLGGYMGQTHGRALEIKRKLLALEAAIVANGKEKN
ncbi:MAG: MGMT family protein [Methylococcales bacterium]